MLTDSGSPPVENRASVIPARMRSATSSAPRSPVSMRIAANSWPPKRAARSTWRTESSTIRAAPRIARSPAPCPCSSLKARKLSRSQKSRDNSPPSSRQRSTSSLRRSWK